MDTSRHNFSCANSTSDSKIKRKANPSLPRNNAESDSPNSDDDFASVTGFVARKRKKGAEPNEEKNLCSICYSHWTNIGKHRTCSLKCGHLFGRSCIE